MFNSLKWKKKKKKSSQLKVKSGSSNSPYVREGGSLVVDTPGVSVFSAGKGGWGQSAWRGRELGRIGVRKQSAMRNSEGDSE